MDVRLAGVLALEVLVRHVRVVQRRVVVLVRSAEVLEAPGHLVVVVRHVEVPVGMHQPLVVMFFTPGRGRVLGHGNLLLAPRHATALPGTCYPSPTGQCGIRSVRAGLRYGNLRE
jgi:hypothetical protein